MLKQIYILLLLPVCLMTFFAGAALAQEEPANLLKHPNAQDGAGHWKAEGKTAIDESTGSFVVRDGGLFHQEVTLPKDSAGQYVVVMASAASERINPDGATTGLPSLYGYMMTFVAPGGGRIYSYLHGPQMQSSSRVANEWVKLWGVFRVPHAGAKMQLFLRQTLMEGVPFNGSAARFRDVGIYLFTTELQARAFVGARLSGANSIGATKETQNSSGRFQCGLKPEQAPLIDNLRLGMSLEQTATLLPVTEEDMRRSSFLSGTAYAKAVGTSSLSVTPTNGNFQSTFGDARQYSLRFLDGKLYHLHLLLNNVEARDVDELLRKWAGVWNLPPPENWEMVEGQGTRNRGKYLLCDGFEVMAYGSPDKKIGYLWIVDTRAEKLAGERGAKVNEAINR